MQNDADSRVSVLCGGFHLNGNYGLIRRVRGSQVKLYSSAFDQGLQVGKARAKALGLEEVMQGAKALAPLEEQGQRQEQKKKQIPFGNDRQKGTSNSRYRGLFTTPREDLRGSDRDDALAVASR